MLALQRFWDTLTQPKRILAIVLGILASGALIGGIIIAVLSLQDNNISVREALVTNVSESAFTLTWISDSPTIGKVVYQEGNASWPTVLAQLGKPIAADDRDVEIAQDNSYVEVTGGARARYTHHVTVRGLKPNTEYSFRVAGAVNGKETDIKTIKTAEINENIFTPDPAYGILQTGTPDDAVVIFDLLTPREGQTTYLQSATTNAQSGYTIDMNVFKVSGIKATDLIVDVRDQNKQTGGFTFTLPTYKPLETIKVTFPSTEIPTGQVNQNNQSQLVKGISAQFTARGQTCTTTGTTAARCEYNGANVRCNSGGEGDDNLVDCTCPDGNVIQNVRVENGVANISGRCIVDGSDTPPNTPQTNPGTPPSPIAQPTPQPRDNCRYYSCGSQINDSGAIVAGFCSVQSGCTAKAALCGAYTTFRDSCGVVTPETPDNPPVDIDTPPIPQENQFVNSIVAFTDAEKVAIAGYFLISIVPSFIDFDSSASITPVPGGTTFNSAVYSRFLNQVGREFPRLSTFLRTASGTQLNAGLDRIPAASQTGFMDYLHSIRGELFPVDVPVINTQVTDTYELYTGLNNRSERRAFITNELNKLVISICSFSLKPEDFLDSNGVSIDWDNSLPDNDRAFFTLLSENSGNLCYRPIEDSHITIFQLKANAQSTILTGSLVGQVLAEGDAASALAATESGRYAFFQDGARIADKDIIVDGDQATIRLFNDLNGNGVKDETETYFTDYSQITLSKEAATQDFTIEPGWNLINLPMVDNRAENAVVSASDLIDYWNAQGADITTVAKYQGDRFVSVVKREGQVYDIDFDLIPGQAVFVLNRGDQSRTTFSGNTFPDGIKLQLNNGWNLVGIMTADGVTPYNSEVLLSKLRQQSFQADTVSQYVSGNYQSVILNNGVLFGNNFNLTRTRGYFVRVEQGGGINDFTP